MLTRTTTTHSEEVQTLTQVVCLATLHYGLHVLFTATLQSIKSFRFVLFRHSNMILLEMILSSEMLWLLEHTKSAESSCPELLYMRK